MGLGRSDAGEKLDLLGPAEGKPVLAQRHSDATITVPVILAQEPITGSDVGPNVRKSYFQAMDIYQTRRENLQRICDALADGNQARLAGLLDRPQSLVNRYLRTKTIGGKFARYVEGVFGMAEGALDVAYDASAQRETVLIHGYNVTPEMAQLASEMEKLDPEVREQIAQMVHVLVANKRRGDRRQLKSDLRVLPPPPPPRLKRGADG